MSRRPLEYRVSADGAGPEGALEPPTAGAGSRLLTTDEAPEFGADDVGAGEPPEILASTLWTVFWRSTNCWFSLPMRDLISSRLSESPWTCVDMVSRRAPELACTSCTDFSSELIVAPSLLT